MVKSYGSLVKILKETSKIIHFSRYSHELFKMLILRKMFRYVKMRK